MTARSETKILIARQIAINNGRNLDNIAPALRFNYLTLAENILATVERKLRAEDNSILDYIQWR